MGLERLGLGAILDFSAGAAIVNMRDAGTAAGRLKSSLQSVGRGAAAAQRGVGQMASGAMRLLAPAVAAAGAAAGTSVKKYLGFEEALTKIATILPGGNRAAEAWGESIQGMGVKFGKASRDVGEGVYQAISASVPAGEALQFLDVVGRTATGGFTDLGASVKVVASTVNAYGKQLGETATYTGRATRASDVLLKAVELGQIEFSEMASTLGYILPTAAGAKVSMEEVAAAWATATASGQSASSSATALRQAIGAIIAPTKKARDQAEELGIQFNQQALEEKGLLGVLKDVGKATGGNTKQLDALFGSIEALNIVMALSQDGAGAFERNLTAMNTAAGTTDRQFQAVAESSGFKLQQVWSALGVLAEQVGGAILKGLGIEGVGKLAEMIQAKTPAIVAGVERFVAGVRAGIASMAPAFETIRSMVEPILARLAPQTGSLAEAFGRLAGRAIALAPAALVLSTTLGPLMQIVGGGANLVVGLAGAFGGLTKVLSMVGTVGLGPLGVILAAVGALIYAITTDTGGLRTALEPLGAAFMQVVEAVRPLVEMVGSFLADAFKRMAEQLGAVLTPVVRTVSSLFEALAPVLGTISDLSAALWEAIRPLVDILGGALTWALKVVAEILEYTIKPVLQAVVWLIDQFTMGIGEMTKRLRAAGVPLQTTAEGLEHIKSSMAQAGVKIPGFNAPAHGAPVQQAASPAQVAAREAQSAAQMARLTGGHGAPQAVQLGGVLGNIARETAALKAENAKAVGKAAGKAAAAKKQCVEVNSKLHVDGREMHAASSRSRLELTERAGAQVTPYQRRQIIERGSVGRA